MYTTEQNAGADIMDVAAETAIREINREKEIALETNIWEL
jgi:hypothetical protein